MELFPEHTSERFAVASDNFADDSFASEATTSRYTFLELSRSR
jgi:hypothetical protein